MAKFAHKGGTFCDILAHCIRCSTRVQQTKELPPPWIKSLGLLQPFQKLVKASIQVLFIKYLGYGFHTVRIEKLANSLDFKIHGPLSYQWTLLSSSCLGFLLLHLDLSDLWFLLSQASS